MRTNILANALSLPDQELLARIGALAGNERQATVELVAHLAALDLRPSLYAALGYGSLFAYCVQALHLSEDAACNRIDAARVCRRFPGVLDRLASGSISLSALRLLKPHLTVENHGAVLDRAAYMTRRGVEALVAELAPQPDVPTSIRKLPSPRASGGPAGGTSSDVDLFQAVAQPGRGSGAPVSAARARTDRPIVESLAPRRYRVQFTIGEEAHDDLQRVQALLRREIPSGDVGAVFEQALRLLREKVERDKLGRAARPRSRPVIRAGTDNRGQDATPEDAVSPGSRPATRSRHIPNEVKREVWRRDAGQCAFVSGIGLRCSERSFLELHHIRPFALDGPPTVGNISLRCRRHNQYEAEMVFAPRVGSTNADP